MTILSLIQQVVQQVQFFTMLQQLNIHWPSAWVDVTGWLSFFTLDVEQYVGQQDIPLIDFRSLFIIISIIVPIVLNLILLLVFQPLYIVLWYLALCGGAILLVAGFFAQVIPGGTGNSQLFIIIGACLFGVATLSALGVFLYKRCLQTETAEEKFEATRANFLKFHRHRTLIQSGVILLLLLAGLFLAFSDQVTIYGADLSPLRSSPFVIAGYIFLGFAAVGMFIAVMCCTSCGRKVLLAISTFLQRNLLMIMLMLISLSFIPVVQFAMGQFLCARYQCPAGYRFNPYAPRNSNDYDISPKRFCDACTIQQCARTGTIQSLCPAFDELRMWKHPEVPCGDNAIFFSFAAAIVIFCYACGLPLCYYLVIRYLTKQVDEDAVTGLTVRQEEVIAEDELWVIKMSELSPVAASLYEAFRLPRRFYILVSMLHRLCTTVALSIASAYSSAASALVLVIHAAACVFVAALRPYVSFAEQVIGTVFAICNVLNGIYAVYIWREGENSTSTVLTGAFIAANVVLPLIAGITGFIIHRRRAKEAKKLLNEALAEQAPAPAVAVDRVPTPQPEVRSASPLPSGQEPAETVPMTEEEMEAVRELDGPQRVALLRRRAKNSRKVNFLNEESTKVLNSSFSVLGLFFFFAGGIAALGYLRQPLPTFLPGSSRLQTSTFYTLGSYASWTDFSQNCCCFQQNTGSLNFNVSERWVCANGNTVERGRVSKTLIDDGLPLRSLCSTTFRTGCFPTVTNNRLRVVCSEQPPVTTTAWNYLW